MLPVTVLKAAQNNHIMVEVKAGETYSGLLVLCDKYQNIHMRDVTLSDANGEHFYKLPETYIRGNSVKYVRLPTNVTDMVAEGAAQPNKPQNKGKGKGKRAKGEAAGPGTRANPAPHRRDAPTNQRPSKMRRMDPNPNQPKLPTMDGPGEQKSVPPAPVQVPQHEKGNVSASVGETANHAQIPAGGGATENSPVKKPDIFDDPFFSTLSVSSSTATATNQIPKPTVSSESALDSKPKPSITDLLDDIFAVPPSQPQSKTPAIGGESLDELIGGGGGRTAENGNTGQVDKQLVEIFSLDEGEENVPVEIPAESDPQQQTQQEVFQTGRQQVDHTLGGVGNVTDAPTLTNAAVTEKLLATVEGETTTSVTELLELPDDSAVEVHTNANTDTNITNTNTTNTNATSNVNEGGIQERGIQVQVARKLSMASKSDACQSRSQTEGEIDATPADAGNLERVRMLAKQRSLQKQQEDGELKFNPESRVGGEQGEKAEIEKRKKKDKKREGGESGNRSENRSESRRKQETENGQQGEERAKEKKSGKSDRKKEKKSKSAERQTAKSSERNDERKRKEEDNREKNQRRSQDRQERKRTSEERKDRDELGRKASSSSRRREDTASSTRQVRGNDLATQPDQTDARADNMLNKEELKRRKREMRQQQGDGRHREERRERRRDGSGGDGNDRNDRQEGSKRNQGDRDQSERRKRKDGRKDDERENRNGDRDDRRKRRGGDRGGDRGDRRDREYYEKRARAKRRRKEEYHENVENLHEELSIAKALLMLQNIRLPEARYGQKTTTPEKKDAAKSQGDRNDDLSTCAESPRTSGEEEGDDAKNRNTEGNNEGSQSRGNSDENFSSDNCDDVGDDDRNSSLQSRFRLWRRNAEREWLAAKNSGEGLEAAKKEGNSTKTRNHAAFENLFSCFLEEENISDSDRLDLNNPNNSNPNNDNNSNATLKKKSRPTANSNTYSAKTIYKATKSTLKKQNKKSGSRSSNSSSSSFRQMFELLQKTKLLRQQYLLLRGDVLYLAEEMNLSQRWMVEVLGHRFGNANTNRVVGSGGAGVGNGGNSGGVDGSGNGNTGAGAGAGSGNTGKNAGSGNVNSNVNTSGRSKSSGGNTNTTTVGIAKSLEPQRQKSGEMEQGKVTTDLDGKDFNAAADVVQSPTVKGSDAVDDNVLNEAGASPGGDVSGANVETAPTSQEFSAVSDNNPANFGEESATSGLQESDLLENRGQFEIPEEGQNNIDLVAAEDGENDGEDSAPAKQISVPDAPISDERESGDAQGASVATEDGLEG